MFKGKKLSKSHIGVISPYVKQCQMIKTYCRVQSHEAISVGTAEVFQGQERYAILISTVRSGPGSEDGLGFVKDEKVCKSRC